MNSCLPPEARCVQCGYALRGLSEDRCPECGRAFDPGDPESFALPGEGGRRTWRELTPEQIRFRARIAVVAGVVSALSLPPPAARSFVHWVYPLCGLAVLLGRVWPTPGTVAVMVTAIVAVGLLLPGTMLDQFITASPSVLCFVLAYILLGATLYFEVRWRIGRGRSSAESDLPGNQLDGRTRRALGIVLTVFWLNLALPSGAGTVTFWLNAPFVWMKADEVIKAGVGERHAQFVGLWLVNRVVLRSRGTVEFLMMDNDDARAGLVYVPPGQDLGPPYRSTRIWPLRNWRFFSF